MFEGLFQPMHLLVIFGIALLVFGPKKLPEEKPATTTTTIAHDQS
jgi:Sec-independent protein translocase protein TatA